MDRMKTFRTYLILFILFYIYVSVISYFLVKSTYYDMEYQLSVDSPKVIVNEAKVSRVSGYIEGVIENNTEETFNNGYIKFELISDKETSIIDKYVDISNLKPGEKKEFSVKFNAENIIKCNISFSEENEMLKANTKFKADAKEIISVAVIVLTAFKLLKFVF